MRALFLPALCGASVTDERYHRGGVVMTMKRFAFTAFALAFSLAACSEEAPPPVGPADSPPAASPETPPATPPFAGAWAADSSWCGNTAAGGDAVPIRISPTRFEGYENRCDIVQIDGGGTSWTATLSCEAEGETYAERVRMDVVGDAMNLVYLDRGGQAVALTRCPAVVPTR